MGEASRRKGARGELEFIQHHLAPYWPETARNYAQHAEDKRDAVRCGSTHWQVKRTERLDLWAAIRQAQQETIGGDLPVVAFRRNHSSWYCIVAADDFVPMLAVALKVAGRSRADD